MSGTLAALRGQLQPCGRDGIDHSFLFVLAERGKHRQTQGAIPHFLRDGQDSAAQSQTLTEVGEQVKRAVVDGGADSGHPELPQQAVALAWPSVKGEEMVTASPSLLRQPRHPVSGW